MRDVRAYLLATVVMTMAAARPVLAQEAEAAVAATVLRFVDALEAGDAAALEKLIAVETPAQERTVKVFVQLVAAQKSLERAAKAKFGDDEKRFRCGFDLIVNTADRKSIQSARVILENEGHTATVEKAGELTSMTLRRGSNNQWQVQIEAIENEPTEPERFDGQGQRPFLPGGFTRYEAMAQIRLARYNAVIDAFRSTQARIESGELTTAALAQAELLKKISDAAVDAAKARAAMPDRRRAGERSN